EEREGARGNGDVLERKRFDLREQLVERRCARSAVAARATRSANRLDGLEGRFSLETTNDTTEPRGEPPHVVVQWHVFASDARAGQRAKMRIGSGGDDDLHPGDFGSRHKVEGRHGSR